MPILLMVAAATALDPGPAPDRALALAEAEAEIRTHLVDPASAQFSWPYSIEIIEDKALLSKRERTWRTCGTLNSRNRMGGYSGTAFVIATFADGKLAATGIGEDTIADPVNLTCQAWIKKGAIARFTAAAPALSGPAEIASRGAVGVAFLPSSAGSVIEAVAPGSPADRAGLRVGDVIQAANGISLLGLDQPTSSAIFARLPSRFVLTIAGRGEITVSRE